VDSYEVRLSRQPVRRIKPDEAALLRQLIREAALGQVHLGEDGVDDLQVRDMLDGGMGSLRIVHSDERQPHFGAEVAKLAFHDSDGVYVDVTLNLDQHGRLFEMDVFKADGTAVRR